jgi:chromosome partitioning protein
MTQQLSADVQEGEKLPDATTGEAFFVNILKGGEGKSVISINLTDRLANLGYNVLYVDADKNGHGTTTLGYEEVYKDSTHDLSNTIIHEDIPATEWIYETEWGWDIVPASVKHEQLDSALSDVDPLMFRDNFLTPLFNEGYDYIIVDGGGEWSSLAKAAYAGTGKTIIPVTPGKDSRKGFKLTYQRVVEQIQEKMDFEITAIVPNMISHRLDHDAKDRRLMKPLTTKEKFSQHLPAFARVSTEEWDKIDAGELNDLPKPGIREDSDFENAFEKKGLPIGHYKPRSDTVERLDQLARVVERGGVSK